MVEDPRNISVVEQAERISAAAVMGSTHGTGLIVSVRGCVKGPGLWPGRVEGHLREQLCSTLVAVRSQGQLNGWVRKW